MCVPYVHIVIAVYDVLGTGHNVSYTKIVAVFPRCLCLNFLACYMHRKGDKELKVCMLQKTLT